MTCASFWATMQPVIIESRSGDLPEECAASASGVSPASACLLDRRGDQVVLVGKPGCEMPRSVAFLASDDDRRMGLLQRFWEDVIGDRPLPDDLGELAVELVEAGRFRTGTRT